MVQYQRVADQTDRNIKINKNEACVQVLSKASKQRHARSLSPTDGGRLVQMELEASAWSGVGAVPPDAIFGMKQKFTDDANADKVNLTVGSYATDEGKEYLLPTVRAAELAMATDPALSHGYLKITGDDEFINLSLDLAFGADSPVRSAKRVAGVQTLSGTGALRLLATFLARALPGKPLLVSRPTWGNHVKIFRAAGLEQRGYRYWEPDARALDLGGMLADLRAAPMGSIVLLHACAHNPTGVDPTKAQWTSICDTMLARGQVAFFDMAYQGYATGDVDDDAWALRYFVKRGVDVLAAQSYAKNMGLYGERVGCAAIVCGSSAEASAVRSNVAAIVRPMYSNPPRHGAAIVKRVLGSASSRAQWTTELKQMAARISAMRIALHTELVSVLNTPGDWSHVLAQIGMFCYTGLSEVQVQHCIDVHHVYLLNSGRISVAGLNTGNVAQVARAFDSAVRNCHPAARL